MKKHLIGLAKGLGAIAFWIFVWFIVARSVGVEMILPTPLAVFKALIALIKTKDFWLASGLSFLRVLLGITASLFLGCLLAAAMSRFSFAKVLFSPVMSVIKATPVASFIIILWLWLDTSVLPVFIASLIVIPIVVSNVCEGIASVDGGLLEVSRLYRLSPTKRLFKLYIPSVVPYFLAACRSAFGMAWKASVASELIVLSKSSIGKEIFLAKQDFESAPVFAWTVVVIILSIIFEKAAMLILDRIGKAVTFIPKGDKNAQT